MLWFTHKKKKEIIRINEGINKEVKQSSKIREGFPVSLFQEGLVSFLRL